MIHPETRKVGVVNEDAHLEMNTQSLILGILKEISHLWINICSLTKEAFLTKV